jgi:hypothetical protein
LAEPGETGRQGREPLGGGSGIAAFLELCHGFTPFTAGVGHPEDLVKTGVEGAAALPVERQIDEHAPRVVVVAEALAGFGQFDDALFHDLGGEFAHAVGQTSCGGNTERLTQKRDWRR